MKIYDTKTIDVGVNGKLRTVSLKQLLRLITDGKTPAISRQGQADLKKLIWLLAQIRIEGDWLFQSPWAVANDYSKANT
jgi:hypothetical protein